MTERPPCLASTMLPLRQKPPRHWKQSQKASPASSGTAAAAAAAAAGHQILLLPLLFLCHHSFKPCPSTASDVTIQPHSSAPMLFTNNRWFNICKTLTIQPWPTFPALPMLLSYSLPSQFRINARNDNCLYHVPYYHILTSPLRTKLTTGPLSLIAPKFSFFQTTPMSIPHISSTPPHMSKISNLS